MRNTKILNIFLNVETLRTLGSKYILKEDHLPCSRNSAPKMSHHEKVTEELALNSVRP